MDLSLSVNDSSYPLRCAFQTSLPWELMPLANETESWLCRARSEETVGFVAHGDADHEIPQ